MSKFQFEHLNDEVRFRELVRYFDQKVAVSSQLILVAILCEALKSQGTIFDLQHWLNNAG
jgi:hypothetical protein